MPPHINNDQPDIAPLKNVISLRFGRIISASPAKVNIGNSNVPKDRISFFIIYLFVIQLLELF